MTITRESSPSITAPALHPLEPLSPAEIERAVAIVRQEKRVGNTYRFPCVTLREPAKAFMLGYQPGDLFEREAFLILLDNATGKTYEAIVSLNQGTVTRWTGIPDVQPNIMPDELVECEAAVKQHPEFLAALEKRGITDLDLVVVDPWAPGNFGFEDEVGIRISRCICYLRANPEGNFYSRPIDGLIPMVNLNTMEVIRIEDHGVVPVPPDPGEYEARFMPDMRKDIKPLHITQPEGPSFEVEGHHIRWQKWDLRIGFNPREGLVLYQVGYEDEGRLRPILYRASMAEMVVPYGDPRIQHYRKNAFDIGEHGIGILANSLKLGCDCLGEIYYFDGVLTDSRGNVSITENAVCMHEEDYGILWKHTDWRRESVEVRRSRRLVLSFIATVDNYEYGFFWYFYQDGTIQYEVKLTGILLCGALMDFQKYGTVVAPELNGLNHQHIFCMRLDFDIDGCPNTVYEVNSESAPPGPDNPMGNAFFATSTPLKTEQEAKRIIDPLKARYWKIVNPSVKNRLDQPVGFKLIPGENVLPFAHPDSPILKRAGFMAQHLWVTPYDDAEKHPAGNYPNQHAGGEGLPKWTQANRSIEETDVVMWYVFGHHHITRPEDWPIMPTAYSGFMIKPVGFFNANPALDVPPTSAYNGEHCHK
ncbi:MULTISPECIES: primary-amine oxidase [unclassified Leptolyngbya]|uniref:primary-amine oxidase n=1 Tax=unclassified Leptolyngbya TaxID=2650499 RepID=UPI0016842984|nr:MULTISPECIES: primary-amine oxidase [unclassified Leptolyngbya]MBD1910222.1 primary-amine oxidase [Leptolyngbya sp. FACHB-8]MBD2156402.1 primary-amine oxidase [Leptolyngbya sp. FACHB-16]